MDKLEIKMVLESLSNFPRPLDKKGNLDITAFNDLPETKEAIQTLKELGVNSSKDLEKLGFIPACLILKF
jgi:RNase H-fold protein (predicted Holliday junction resolvase)